MSPQITDYPNFFILILFAFLLKALFDFKSLGGFNYPLLIKLLYMIMLILAIVVLLHPEDLKKTLKQTKIEDYIKNNLNRFNKHKLFII